MGYRRKCCRQCNIPQIMSYMTKQTTGGKNAYCFNHNCTFLDCNPNTPLLFHLTI